MKMWKGVYLDYKVCKCDQDQTHFFFFLQQDFFYSTKWWSEGIDQKKVTATPFQWRRRERVGQIPQKGSKNSDFMRWYEEKLVTLDPMENGVIEIMEMALTAQGGSEEKTVWAYGW